MKPTVMLIGLGGLGSVMLELLAREERVGRILVGSRKPDLTLARCNLARLAALAQGYNPDIRFVPLDLYDIAATATTIRQELPDLIISTATMQTWWLSDLFPSAPAHALKSAGFGMWLPVHLTLTMKLMQAVRAADYRGFVLTAPFPDVVNCVLGRINLAPTCGVGNLDEIVPKLRLLAAERLQTSLERIRVLLVAHHALEEYAFGTTAQELPPYFLRIEYAGQDVTQEIRADELLRAPYALTAGPPTHFLTAGSALRLILALSSTQETFLHAPGPAGLPGGYPLLVSQAGLRHVELADLSLAEAIAINEQSHRFDGIERIEDDGMVVFRPEVAASFRDLLGYDCERLRPDEAEARAQELMARFRAYAQWHGVTLPG